MPPQKKFVPRQRKHKVIARQNRDRGDAQDGGRSDRGTAAATATAAGPTPDSNAAEILPEEVRARNAEKARLRAELRAGQASQMSAKKAKRLEKYIETKLRKDESRALNEKLAAAAAAQQAALEAAGSADPTAVFESSRDLGKGKRRRRVEQQKQALQRRQRQAAGEDDDDDDVDDDSSTASASADEAESDAEPAAVQKQPKSAPQPEPASHPAPETTQAPAARNAESTAPAQTQPPPPTAGVVAGSGLKRPLALDADGRPVLQKRQKRGGVKSKFITEVVASVPERAAKPFVDNEASSGSEWNGFSDEEASQSSGKEDAEEKDDGEDEEDDEDDEEDDEDEEEEDSDDDDDDDDTPRISGFKAWAQQQRNAALGFQPTTAESAAAALAVPKPANFEPRPVEEEPLPEELRPTPATGRQVFNVAVARTAEMEAARLALPIVAEEHQILEAIHAHDVVVVTGGTGSGKTTQVPQFLYEAGYGAPGSATPGMIGVTQPRRVAAVSMAQRVAEELGPEHGRRVGYQIRFEGTADAGTAIKFMTDGVLLREMTRGDMLLSRYSAVLVDEAHERSINTDLLIGLLSRVNAMRARAAETKAGPRLGPLKVVIMSATLQTAALTQAPGLFRGGPVRTVSVEGRQHPVTEHFARVTRHDYVEEAFRKIVRGHRQLPPGGFLVFLTGEEEIQRLAKRLRLEVNGADTATRAPVRLSASEYPLEEEDIDFAAGGEDDDDEPTEDAADDDYDDDNEEDEFVADEGEQLGTGPLRMHVLPLYAKLPTQEQQKVFREAPAGCRSVVLATNVAETSLTIPGVRYVFDSGRAKERKYNAATGVQSFEVCWISKASAAQRAGRAGRTGPGHCYRLYSSAVFEEHFPAFAVPEIQRAPMEGVVLQLRSLLDAAETTTTTTTTPSKAMDLRQFPFPTAPDAAALAQAERVLQYLSALRPTGHISPLGMLMAAFPLSPRFAKMLLVSHVDGCLPYMVVLVAALSAGDEVFVRPERAFPGLKGAKDKTQGDADDDDDARPAVRTPADVQADDARRAAMAAYAAMRRHFAALDPMADALGLLQVACEFLAEPTPRWCAAHFVQFKTLGEIRRMAQQLHALLRAHVPLHRSLPPVLAAARDGLGLARPSPAQCATLKQLVAAGYVENLAIRADAHPRLPPDLQQQWQRLPRLARPTRAIDVPYVTLLPVAVPDDKDEAGVAARPPGTDATTKRSGYQFVFIHPWSAMARLSVAECPMYVCYAHLVRSQARGAVSLDDGGGGGGDGAAAPAPAPAPRIRMRPLTDLAPGQLLGLLQGTPLLSYGKPIKTVSESADGSERQVWVVPYVQPETAVGGYGWPLPATKIWQRKEGGRGWQTIRKG